MRTAKQIIIDLDIAAEEGSAFTVHSNKPAFSFNEISQIVCEARKETIEACIEIVHDQMILSHPEFIKEQLINLKNNI